MKDKRTAFSATLLTTLALAMVTQAPATSRFQGPSSAGIAFTTEAPQVKSSMQKLNRFEKRYHRVWRLVKDQYLYHERLMNWDQWQHRFDGKLKSDAETRKAITAMLDSLEDPYTYVRDPDETHRVNDAHEQDKVVSSRMLSNNVGYIKLDTFNSKRLIKETRKALKQLSNATAYVIDVRGNKGGLVDVAFREFGLFVNQGTFTAFRGRPHAGGQKTDLILTANSNQYLHEDRTEVEPREPNLSGQKPLVILVDEETRSAAEMFAGALRDHGRAKIVGRTTYGKGILQDIVELEDGSSVKIVTARYFLPRGEFIHRRGLTPDTVVSKSEVRDVPIRTALRALQETVWM